MTKQNKPKNKGAGYNAYAKYSSLAVQMVLTLGIAIYLGWLLDSYLELKWPLFMILSLLIATGGVFFMLYRSIQKDDKDG